MNERIRKLALQTGFTQQDLAHGRDQMLAEFAELIVRECARVIDRGDGEMSSQAETIWCNVCRDDILKHFGVE